MARLHPLWHPYRRVANGIRRTSVRLSARIGRAWAAVRVRRAGAPKAPVWRQNWWPWRVVAAFGDVLFVAWATFLFAGKRLPFGWFDGTKHPDILVGVTFLLAPLLLLAPTFTVFLWWRYSWSRNRYLKSVKRHPEYQVDTAGSVLKRVVGRDQLCQTLAADLRGRNSQPSVIVGGVGAGKTAVLVELTRQLAQRRAVPVNIELSKAATDHGRLDFEELARNKLQEEMRPHLLTDADGPRIWRQLRRDHRVVVLADGLDEALSADDNPTIDRSTAIRNAIRSAKDQKLPLIVASRPYDPLRAMDAAMTELEPLGDGPAREFLYDGADPVDRQALSRIVGELEVAEDPWYLNMLRQVYRHAPFKWHTLVEMSERGAPGAGKRQLDRSGLRLELSKQWQAALEEGYLNEDYSLTHQLRVQVIECMSVLALVGLLTGQHAVSFRDALMEPPVPDARGHGSGEKSEPELPQPWLDRLMAELADRLDRRLNTEPDGSSPPQARWRGPSFEPRTDPWYQFWTKRFSVLATMADELGIVQATESSVRFRYSLMQTYLGSRYLPVLLNLERTHPTGTALKTALRKHNRELLLALVLTSRDSQAPSSDQAQSPGGDWEEAMGQSLSTLAQELTDPTYSAPARRSPDVILALRTASRERPAASLGARPGDGWEEAMVDSLSTIAKDLTECNPPKALDLYETALEIAIGPRLVDTVGRRLVPRLTETLRKGWSEEKFESPDIRDPDLEESRRRIVHTMGRAVRAVSEGNGERPDVEALPRRHR